MTTDSKKPDMLATKPERNEEWKGFPSLDDLDGLSIRFALTPTKAEGRVPKKKGARNATAEGKGEDLNNKAPPASAIDHQKELLKLFHSFSSRRHHWQVFTDFCEMGSISFSNAVDLAQREKREERYMQIVKGYSREEADALARGLAHLTMALEDDFSDVLGRTFHDLELHNKWAGQFFSPYHLCRMMARMTIGDTEDLKARIAERGFVTAQEPAVGSGAMVIALAQEMRDASVNYQEHLHVTAIDVDAKCVHMAYLQFSLLHIPAVIVHGNTLSLEEYSHWYTPAHIMGGWNWKLRRRSESEGTHEIHAPPKIEAAPVEAPLEQKTDAPRGQLKLF
jgi:hypothetical protein